jgi:ribosomal protein S18 acetylase RimI-like enzyme
MNWWQRLRDDPLLARPAMPIDRPVVAELLARAVRRHGVLAVEEQGALLNSGISTLAFLRDRVVGFLGLRLRERNNGETERWADAAMIMLAAGAATEVTLAALLRAALPLLRSHGVTSMVCLTGEGWLHDNLAQIQFRDVDQVITYARSNRLPIPPAHPVAHLRTAGASEAGTMLALNSAAFSPLWRYDSAITLSWLLTSDHAVIAERNEHPVGFALTSHAPTGGYDQLIRLATHPSAQRLGIGRQLVVDSIAYSQEIAAPGLALNTQASNTASRHLYEALDFRVIGAPVIVMIYPVN